MKRRSLIGGSVGVFSFLRSVVAKADAQADAPQAFGYKTGWLAVSSEDVVAVMHHLGMTDVQGISWKEGLRVTTAYPANGTPAFVTPAMKGWTLVVTGLNLDSDSEAFRKMLGALSLQFGDTQYFASYRVVGLRVWQRARNGTLERAFSVSDGGVTQNTGTVTPEERALGLPDISGISPDHLNDVEANDPDNRWIYGSEEDPLLMAGMWSLNPDLIGLDSLGKPSVGNLGQLPLE